MPDLRREALAHLRILTDDPSVQFRDGQFAAIRALVSLRRRAVVVQRTGWGKSAVYFIATKMLRDRGSGPTLLVSPLISLMDNQMEAATRIGLRAEVVNSTNRTEWDDVRARLEADQIDVLLLSEIRLASDDFRRDWMPALARPVGLLVVDEVHCISDWGHDFRPNYRRIGRILQLLPDGVPVVGCTATANDRVVDDVVGQLGERILTIRGSLARPGLRLEVHTDKPEPDSRMAWLVENIPDLPGAGIVYCLTRRDVDVVADFLADHGIDCGRYLGSQSDEEQSRNAATLSRFVRNELKCVVATTALGMGYDKPDVGFVIHFQSPSSPIAYYQQAGRAGRAVPESYGILLAGSEDGDIQDWFISQAFPSPEEVDSVLAAVEQEDGPIRDAQIAARVNIATRRLKNLMDSLEVEGAVTRTEDGWIRTLAPWRYPHERIRAVNAWRREEQAAMEHYLVLDSCRMAELQTLLDDPLPEPCGVCDNCRGEKFGTDASDSASAEARDRLRHQYVEIPPRARWPPGLSEPSGAIPIEERAQTGWCLTRWGAAGWGELVRKGKFEEGRFSPELITALAELARRQIEPLPPWITYVPSLRHPELVQLLAGELGHFLEIPVHDAVRKAHQTAPQKEMQNSASQVKNIWNVFLVDDPVPTSPCLLVDDVIDSRWTVTVIASLLRRAGAEAVVPLALGYTGQ